MSEWIKYDGVGFISGDDVLIQVKYTDGDVSAPSCPSAFRWGWKFGGTAGGDIVAYRVVADNKPVKDAEGCIQTGVWYEHDGSAQPVADDVMVEVEVIDNLLGNSVISGTGLAKEFHWCYTPPATFSDIARYKIVEEKKHSHYFKDCPYDKVDIYRILDIFNVTDSCLQHCIKKLLVAGGRGHKSIEKDIQDCIDTLERWKQMRSEEESKIGN